LEWNVPDGVDGVVVVALGVAVEVAAVDVAAVEVAA
jgi:hypothetical protein